MYSLYIDTHDKSVLIILFKEGKILMKEEVVSSNKHSEITLPLIASILEKNNVDINNINDLIVVNGPGSFTGVRIAVTIAKTIAYCLNISIRAVDALTVLAINDDRDRKIVSLEDRNGAFVGVFDKNNNKTEDFTYMNKSSYLEYKTNNLVLVDFNIDYEKVYAFVKNFKELNPHEVRPLYVKGISALNDKKN